MKTSPIAALFGACLCLSASEVGTIFVDLRKGDGQEMAPIVELSTFEGPTTDFKSHRRLLILGALPDIQRSLWCKPCGTVDVVSSIQLRGTDLWLTLLDVSLHLEEVQRTVSNKPIVLRDSNSDTVGIIDLQFVVSLPIEISLTRRVGKRFYIPLVPPVDRIASVEVLNAAYLGITNDCVVLYDDGRSAEEYAVLKIKLKDDKHAERRLMVQIRKKPK